MPADFYDTTANMYISVDGDMGYLVFNRPEKHNAIQDWMWAAMPDYLKALEADTSVRVVIVCATGGKAFSAGADIEDFKKTAADPVLQEKARVAIRDAQRTLARLKKPSIAMIDGACIGGGCGLAIHCDFRIASDRSKLGITPAKLGLVYSLNDTKHLVDLVGASKAKSMLFTARLVESDEALTIGLVDAVTTVDDLQTTVHDFAIQMIKVSQYSIQGSKKIIQRILDGQIDDDGETSSWFNKAQDEIDHKEGVQAFLEKREANFRWNG